MEQSIDFRTDQTTSETCTGHLTEWIPAPQRQEFRFFRCSGCQEWLADITVSLWTGKVAFFVKAPSHWTEAEVVEQAILTAWERESEEARISRWVEEATERAITRQIEQDRGIARMAIFEARREAAAADQAAREEAGLPEPF